MDKRCEICNEPLSGKQQRFCSRRCRNVVAGRHSTPQYKHPSRDWLAAEYLLPPEGKGRSLQDIANEIGVTDVAIGHLVDKYGLTQGPRERLSFYAKQPHPERRKQSPNRDEFAGLYLMPPDGQGMSIEALCVYYGVSDPTIRRWIDEFGLQQPFSERHSKRMYGEGNPAYLNGNSLRYIRRRLSRTKPAVCEWCGTTKKVQVHHVNHNKENNDPDNLMWLCGPCNRLEAQLWALEQTGRATRHFENNRLVIEFVRKA